MDLATVFIPVFNGRHDHLEETIKAVLGQKTEHPFEVLIIDSGSTDGSVDIIKRFPSVRLIEITNSDFGHGRTRNRAFEETKTPFVAFLTQDATPADADWLQSLLEPFGDDSVAATYGPQIPRPDADPRTGRIISETYDDKTRTITSTSQSFPVFSDVNACYRRADWEKVKFRDVPYAEDHYMLQDLLKLGRKVSYQPAATVIHSNRIRLREHFGRMVDEIGGLPKSSRGVSFKGLAKHGLKSLAKDWLFAWRRSKLRFISDCFFATVAEGQWLVVTYVYYRLPRLYDNLKTNYSLERRRKRRV